MQFTRIVVINKERDPCVTEMGIEAGKVKGEFVKYSNGNVYGHEA